MSASDRLAILIDIAWGRMPASEIKELRAILDDVARLEESHAELLEALESTLEISSGYIDSRARCRLMVLSRSAIAKAKGGK